MRGISRPQTPLQPLYSGASSFQDSDDVAHDVIQPGRVAVVTGAASGIGRAAAKEFARLGLRVAIADYNAEGLAVVEREIAQIQTELAAGQTEDGHPHPQLLAIPTDVSQLDQVVHLRDKIYETWGEVAVLLNNAGIYVVKGAKGTSWAGIDAWRGMFDVNVFGMLNVQQTFVSSMLHQENHAMIINTGSKQGIMNPPGNPAYNATKAALKSFTESLAHELRNRAVPNVTAHLFLPGMVHTALTDDPATGGGPVKPQRAWTADETVLYMLERVRGGEFYILCPDNEMRREVDELRILWGAGDVTEGRPALSRWHPNYKSVFEDYLRENLEGGNGE